MTAVLGYLGLGSNVGERLELLQAAVAELTARGVRVLASSSVYETEPVGEVTDQRAFLNACLRVSVDMTPRELLAAAKDVELALGRDPDTPRHGPRPVDVDLLLLGDLELDVEALALPHRDLTHRRFVLVPLLELDPGSRTPSGDSLAQALLDLDPAEQRVQWAGPPLAIGPRQPLRG